MADTVIFDDLELWLASWLRPKLSDWGGLLVANRDKPGYVYRVIVRDDSGPSGLVTAARRVGIRVVGPAGHELNASNLAQRVAALMRVTPRQETGNPVADVEVTGPYRVSVETDADVEYYLTAALTIVGRPFTL